MDRAKGVRMVAMAALWLGAAGAGAKPTTYYVSSSVGSDTADGLAAIAKAGHGPWRSVGRAASAPLASGDRVLLRAGDTWREGAVFRAGGTASAPITLGAYGVGARPYLRGDGQGQVTAITLDRCSGWRIEGIEFGFVRHAIRIVPDSKVKTEYDGFQIEDCFMHDIANPAFPNVAARDGAQHNDLRRMGYAIFVDGFESAGPVRLKNVIVRHCVAHRAQGFYIHVMGPVFAENVLFDGNTLSHVSYNAIYQCSALRFNIVNSVLVYGYPWAYHPNGATQILAGGIEGDAAQRSEVANNEFGWGGDYPGCPDGCAYDFEGATSGVAFRRNIMHDASGEPVLFMGGFNHKDLLFEGNVLRDCVSYSARWHHYVTVGPSNTGNGAFTGNRFFLQPGKMAFTAKPPAFTFENNEEGAAGEWTAMPMVTRIVRQGAARVYTLESATPGAALRYTTDGSLPGPASRRAAGPIRITRSGALNVRAFRAGMEPSYTNALVVDLRDEEGRAPAIRWSPGAGSRDQGLADALADNFSLALDVAPGAERTAEAETNRGAAGQSGQQFALAPPREVAEGEAGLALSVGTNGVSVYESAPGYQPCMLAINRPISRRHHLVIVYRDRQPLLYIDGVFQKAGCRSERTVRPLFTPGDAAQGFRGRLGEVRVYGRALTNAEIQAMAARP